MSKKKNDEYEYIYDNGINYSELDENDDPEEVIAMLKETLGKGPCPNCGEISMIPDDNGFCYYCLKCGYAENQDAYLRGIAGYPVKYID